ncbi:NADH/ubiquinone/plastoquinone (complex I) [Thioalkalivibrio denitrificans]|uniref:NADH/ubiquinone/plastoquinone (Complex I) n=1 Tax=Thioalkalivibrio denitrificans TaxID=108003 RepID=A0A1V3NI51_9GAMM|nr:complex I subunit 5 family protein [Thioalkalivibrio denitrificans]OOG24725.1 NADH/ubiquinone/plastoquinone (complex I) [Thioalkalivibrio denitrificans]
MTAALLLLVPMLPLLLAVLVVLPGAERARSLVPWAVLPGFLAVVWLPEGAQAVYPWLMLGLELQLDATGRAFLLLTALLWGGAGLYALEYLRGDAHASRFHLFFLLAMSGNLGLVLAADAVGFYVFFALMSLASYGLVIHAGGAEVRRAGRIYLILAVLGEVALFAGLAMQVAAAGGLHFTQLAGAPLSPLSAALLVIGFGIKAGLVPLHVWLPLAHPAAPTPASAVLSGVMIKAGLLGWLRLLQLDGPGWPELGTLLLVLGIAGALLAAAAGVLQRRPKTILAYSSISQMGLMVSGVGLALLLPDHAEVLLAGVLVYALHHGLAKGALFLGVGVAERGRRPWVMAVLAVPALALAGLPWTSGALAKNALKAPLYEAPAPWAGTVETLLTVAAVGTTLLMARFLWRMWFVADRSEGVPGWRMGLPWLAMSAGAVVLPVFWPGDTGPGWSLIWPLGLGVILSVTLVRMLPSRRLPQLAEGDLVVPVERLVLVLIRVMSRSDLLWRGYGEELTRARFRLNWRRLRRRIAALEAGLSRWESLGIVFLALVVALYVSLLP